MDKRGTLSNPSTTDTPCLVLVIYEDRVMREQAARLCDQLERHFDSKHGFEFSWWSFDHLMASLSATEAAQRAAEARLLLFAVRPEGEFPAEVSRWMESWIGLRSGREGTLINLLELSPEWGGGLSAKHQFLRTTARRLGADYLTRLPESLQHLIPDTVEWCAERAGQMTGVLEAIISQRTQPPRSFH